MTDARRIFGKAPTMRLPGGGGEGLWGISSEGSIDIDVVNGDGCIVWADQGAIDVTGVGYAIRHFAGGYVIDFVSDGTAHIYPDDSCASWQFLVHMKLIPEAGGMG